MDELNQYISVAWEPDDLIEIRPLQTWQGLRVWTLAKDLPNHAERMMAENERGANIFAGILPRNKDGGGSAEDVDGGRVIWADFDHCEPEDAIGITGKLEIPIPSMAVATGHGAHLFWRLKDWTEKAEIQRLVSGLITFFLENQESQKYIDKSAKDPARILRLPGFVNHKPPAAKAYIVYADPDMRYTPEDFARFMPQEPEAKPVTYPVPSTTGGGDKIERARRYLAMIPGSAPGGRTNTAYRAACVMVNDIGISLTDAENLLRGWDAGANNPTIAHDYGEGELQKIINNARKYHKKAAGYLNTPKVPATAITHTGGNLADLHPVATFEPLEPMPEHFLDVPGFIKEVMDFNLSTAPKPQPILALAGGIVIQAVLCGRKLTDEAGTRPNLYACGIAQSGAGKDHARQLNKRILLEAGLSHLQAEGIKSGSGLINALVTQPAILFQIDEYGRFIQTANNQGRNPHTYEIISKLLSLYSSSGNVYESDRYADGDKGGKQIKEPHAIVYGTTVPRSLYEGLREESVTDGFLSRTLIFDVDGHNPKRRRVKTMPIPQSIIDTAKWWGDFNPGGGNLNPDAQAHIAPITGEADAIAKAFIEIEHAEQKAMGDSSLATLWTRTAQNADKLALIYAASKSPQSPVIDAEAARWGYGLAEWLTRRMIAIIGDNVADNPFHAECLKVKRIMKRNGGRMDRQFLLKKMKIKARDLDEAINFMLENGELHGDITETSGRHKTIYQLVGKKAGEETLTSPEKKG